MVLLNDFKRQWDAVCQDLQRAFSRVGASGYYVLGPEVSKLEKDLSDWWGLPHTVGVANGMDAIEISLRAAGIRSGDRILTTPLTAFATTLAILRVGARPIFCDVDPNGLMDLADARRILSSLPGIRGMVPVHLYGHCLDLEGLRALKDEFGLVVVEDCAQSIGATWSGLACGSVGDFAATSFYPTKNLGCMGDGGAVLTRSESGAELAKCLRNYGQRRRYEHLEVGLNSRLDEMQAALLSEAILPRLREWTARRKAIAQAYLRGIDNPNLGLCRLPEACESVWHLFPVFVRTSGVRHAFEAHLKRMGVQSACHYPILVQDQQAYQACVQDPQSVVETPIAGRLASTEVSLPIHPFLEESEIRNVIEAANSWKN
jgi:dTDP-3-amino-3,4,6-trideoxy-alpha-D-glucose transaminase